MLPLTCSSSECGQIDPVVSQFQSGNPLEANTQLNGLIDQFSGQAPTEALAAAYFYKGRFSRLQSAYDESLNAFEQSLELFNSLENQAPAA